ncbi:hypothetical protein [Paracoccus laeviglucosivorans]|nr:hypothetical protein [Paracoccus laeviglucosivorans]
MNEMNIKPESRIVVEIKGAIRQGQPSAYAARAWTETGVARTHLFTLAEIVEGEDKVPELTAIGAALSAIQRPCVSTVVIETASTWIADRINGDLPRWRDTGAIFDKKGKPLSKNTVHGWASALTAAEGLAVAARHRSDIDLDPIAEWNLLRAGEGPRNSAEASFLAASNARRAQRGSKARMKNADERNRQAAERAQRANA